MVEDLLEIMFLIFYKTKRKRALNLLSSMQTKKIKKNSVKITEVKRSNLILLKVAKRVKILLYLKTN